MNKVLSTFALTSSLLVAAKPVTLNWLGNPTPAIEQGVRWGVPWSRGVLPRDASFQLTDGKGQTLAVQSWPMAYWPDGSLTWTGHAAAAEKGVAGPFTLSVGGSTAQPVSPLQATQSADAIEIRTRSATYRIPKRGSSLVESIVVDGREIARAGRLIAIREDRSHYATEKVIREEDFTSSIDSAVLERSGPVAAVVKLSGRHKADSGTRLWLPFTVRFYFFAASNDVRMVHSFVSMATRQLTSSRHWVFASPYPCGRICRTVMCAWRARLACSPNPYEPWQRGELSRRNSTTGS